MISRKQCAVIATALISGTAWMASPAQAAAPLPKEGTVLTMLSPATNGCPALNWVVKVGPNDTLNGTVSEMDRTDVWRVTGSFKADRTFHLVGKELTGAQRTGAVDGYVRDSDGSLVFTVGDISPAFDLQQVRRRLRRDPVRWWWQWRRGCRGAKTVTQTP
jgi:hypothetical protein